MTVSVDRGGVRFETDVSLEPFSATRPSAREWLLAILIDCVTSWFSVALGFFVAFLRPRDRLAWLLLLLLLDLNGLNRGLLLAQLVA